MLLVVGAVVADLVMDAAPDSWLRLLVYGSRGTLSDVGAREGRWMMMNLVREVGL